jgi:YD repeat-containing protein
MKRIFTLVAIPSIAVATALILFTGSGCNKNVDQNPKTDSSSTPLVESFHDFFDHYGNLDEVSAFFSPEMMRTHKVKMAKFFDQFAGKPDFAKDLPDEIKHLDSLGRIVKEEFLTIDSTSHAYGSESWKYDAAGRVIESEIVYPDGKVTRVAYAYDANGRILNIDTKAYHTLKPDTSLHFNLIHEIAYVGNGNIPNQILHKKDAKQIGQVSTKWKGDTLVYKYDGEDKMEVSFVCDSTGKVLQMMEIDELPQAINKKHVFGYDNTARVTSKDEHVLMNGSYDIINTTVWGYNEKGLLSHEEVYSVKGQAKTLVDKSVVEYSYYE